MPQHIKWTFVGIRKMPKVQVKYNHKVTKSVSTFCLSVLQHPVGMSAISTTYTSFFPKAHSVTCVTCWASTNRQCTKNGRTSFCNMNKKRGFYLAEFVTPSSTKPFIIAFCGLDSDPCTCRSQKALSIPFPLDRNDL